MGSVHFDELATHIYYIDNEKGEAENAFAKIQFDDGKRAVKFYISSKKIFLTKPKTRVESLNLNLATSQDELFEFQIVPNVNMFMCGLGYMHPDWGHGQFKGELETQYDSYDLSEDPQDPPFSSCAIIVQGYFKDTKK